MEPLYIEKTKTTPQVIFDKSKEVFLFKGWSMPENTLDFYEPIMKRLSEYMNDPNPCTVLTFELEYFNSASSKVILIIVRMLEDLLKKGLEVKVNWHSADEDTLEAGQAYESLTKVPFVFIEK